MGLSGDKKSEHELGSEGVWCSWNLRGREGVERFFQMTSSCRTVIELCAPKAGLLSSINKFCKSSFYYRVPSWIISPWSGLPIAEILIFFSVEKKSLKWIWSQKFLEELILNTLCLYTFCTLMLSSKMTIGVWWWIYNCTYSDSNRWY